MTMTLIRLVLLLAALSMPHAAQAQVKFGTPASGCVPNSATIKNDRTQTGNASVQHAGNNTGLIVLTCTIVRFDESGDPSWELVMLYRDSTGTDNGAVVRARLFRMNFLSGAIELVATVSSNTSPVTTTNQISSGFSHQFQFENFAYWIHVDLDRSTPSQTVVLHVLMLSSFGSPSDSRLKHNVALLGHLDNGLGFYRFSYHGSDKAYVGVMAQEVEAIRPDAVVRGGDGYLRVDYARLGLRMQGWEEWVADGEKLPPTAIAMRR